MKRADQCPTCGIGTIAPATGPGRTIAFRNVPDLPVPEDFAIPTCDHCGQWWINPTVAELLDERMAIVYQQHLAQKVDSAIGCLRAHIRQRDLERLLGLSAGYLSKLKGGKETSGPLAAVLMLLARYPQLLESLRRSWSASAPIIERRESVHGLKSIRPQVGALRAVKLEPIKGPTEQLPPIGQVAA